MEKCTNSRCGIEFPLKDWSPELGTIGFCEECVKLIIKIVAIQKHIEKTRGESPDGMTAWDRVEKYRLEHGHLPESDGMRTKLIPGCKVCEAKQ